MLNNIEILKKCTCCGKEKPLNMFSNLKKSIDGKYYYCKDCKKEKSKKYYQSEKGIKYNKEYRETNKEYKKQYNKEYKKTKKYKEYKKQWKKENKKHLKEKYNKYIINRRKIDLLFKLKHSIGVLIRQSIKNKGYKKNSKTIDILGCTFEEFKQYLEQQFESWMNWNNYGKYNGEYSYGWDIDHIIPLASAKTEEDILKLNHYTNLQPLDSFINRCIKKDKINNVHCP